MSEELSGNALVQACAEQVMGWKSRIFSWHQPDGSNPVAVEVWKSDGSEREIWNPLASMDDCFEMVDAMNVLGWYLETAQDNAGDTHANFNRYAPMIYSAPSCVAKPAGEAICRAALKAIECQQK